MKDKEVSSKNAEDVKTSLNEDEEDVQTFQDLKPEVEESIAKVFPSDDPLDAASFDPIEYVNLRFPTEESLSKIGSILVGSCESDS